MMFDKQKLVNIVFISIIILIVVFILSNESAEIQIDNELIILGVFLILMAIIFVALYIISRFYNSQSKSDENQFNNNDVNNLFEIGGVFEVVLCNIKNDFDTEIVIDEEEARGRLMIFINDRFPDLAQSIGHTSTGKPIDIVIDGTYAIELIIVDSEGRLVSLMDYVLKFMEDFGEVAVVILDTGEVPAFIIEKYVKEFEKIGVRIIVKKASYSK